TPSAEIEFRVARFGAGEAGRRALQSLADVLEASVRAPACGLGGLAANGGLVTRWCTAQPSALGVPPTRSDWREVSEPAPRGAWLPIEAAAFAPIRGVDPPLPVAVEPGPAEDMAPTAVEAPLNGDAHMTLVVRCGGCGRVLDEPSATPTRARL